MNLLSFYINLGIDSEERTEMDSKYRCELEVAYYMALLNNGDEDPRSLGKLEASASNDYVRKVNNTVVERGPITFAMFKDIVTNPLVWERYHQAERQTKAIEENRDSSVIKWEDELYYDIGPSLESPGFSYYSIPFSCSFRVDDLDELVSYISSNGQYTIQNFEGPGACWFQILKWSEDIKYSYRVLPYDEDPRLREVVDWWRNFNPYPTTDTSPCLCAICETASRGDNDGDTPLYLPPTPFLCTICEPASRVNKDEVNPPQLPPMDGLTRPSPTPGLCEIGGDKYDSPQLIQDTQARKIAPLPRRYRDIAEVEDQAEEDEADVLQHPRKKQKTTHIFDYLASETESMMTDTDAGPPESSYEDDMSVDEEFWSAKSTAELSMLSID